MLFNKEKLIQNESNTQNSSEKINFYTFTDINESMLQRKIINFEKEVDNETLELLKINLKQIPSNQTFKKLSEGMMWHIRLRHASINYLKALQKSEEKLKNVKFENGITECETCIVSKMKKQPFVESREKAKKPLHRIYTDAMGPIKPLSYPGDNRYLIIFIDDYTRYAKEYSSRVKSDAGKCLESFTMHMRNLLGKNEKVCYVRADNAKEFTGGYFSEIMKSEKIEEDFVYPRVEWHFRMF